MAKKFFTREQIVETVKSTIAEKLMEDVVNINNSTNLSNDLCADSIDIISIVIDLEKEFGIHISDEKIDIMCGSCTVSQVADIVEELLKEN